MLKRSHLRRSTGEARLTVRAPRKRKCAICKAPATSAVNLKPFCSPECGVELAKLTLAKQDRAKDKATRERLMTLSDWRKRAQAAFNAWIVLRDAALPCVSCGRWHEGRWHAGHFYSTGARPELRFDEANVHKQCAPCNVHLHGNLVLYRATLLQRISLSELMRLEGPNPPRHDTADSLKALAAHYRAKARNLVKKES